MGEMSRHSSFRECIKRLKPSSAIPANKGPVHDVSCSSVPSYECFDDSIHVREACEKLENDAEIGDYIIVKVKRFDSAGVYVKPICFASRIKRDLEILKLQWIAPMSSLRRVQENEYLTAQIVAVQPIRIELLEVPAIPESNLPDYFRNGRDLEKDTSLRRFLKHRSELRNPYLSSVLGFPTSSSFSFLSIQGLETDNLETARAMRKAQDHILAMESATKGVEELKSGNRMGAIQLFNNAIGIDPNCTEAYVARGTAFANDGQYDLGEKDFESALSIDPEHKNANSYLLETLISHANMKEIAGELPVAKILLEKASRLKGDKRIDVALQRIDKKAKKARETSQDVIVIPDDTPRKNAKKAASNEKVDIAKKRADKRKLQEIEDFIKQLKSSK